MRLDRLRIPSYRNLRSFEINFDEGQPTPCCSGGTAPPSRTSSKPWSKSSLNWNWVVLQTAFVEKFCTDAGTVNLAKMGANMTSLRYH